MAEFTVTARTLQERAEELRNLNQQFKNEVSDLEAVEEALSGMWEGEARNEFHKAFQSDKTQMNNFYNAIELYAARLEAAAQKYAQTENANVEIARNRNYK